MTLAFLVYTIGRSPSKFELPPTQQLVAWGILALLLATLVDIDETGEVGNALVMLLLVSILLVYGEGLIKWINAQITTKPDPTTTKVNGKVVPL